MTDNNNNGKPLTPVSELGEFGLIDRLTAGWPVYQQDTLKAVGDDTAVIDSGDHYTLVTKDLLIEGVHFDMVYTPLRHLGYKAVTVNLSDIYAMNGEPRQIVVGLAISSRFSVEALEELYAGIRLACERYKVDLVGGDTTSSPHGMCLSITAIGSVAKNRIAYRSGASVHDILCVSGDLGAAYCGLLVLQREKAAFQANPELQPRMDDYAYILERQLKPEAGKHIVELLAQHEVLPSAMIDVSDGLASEVLHLCKQSGLGALIYEEKIPVERSMAATAHEFGIDPVTCALSGGEDYELLFTIKAADYEKLKDVPGLSFIGHMTDASEGQHMISSSGHLIKLTAQGWDALRRRESTGGHKEGGTARVAE